MPVNHQPRPQTKVVPTWSLVDRRKRYIPSVSTNVVFTIAAARAFLKDGLVLPAREVLA